MSAARPVQVERDVPAPAQALFDLLADPAMERTLDRLVELVAVARE